MWKFQIAQFEPLCGYVPEKLIWLPCKYNQVRRLMLWLIFGHYI